MINILYTALHGSQTRFLLIQDYFCNIFIRTPNKGATIMLQDQSCQKGASYETFLEKNKLNN